MSILEGIKDPENNNKSSHLKQQSSLSVVMMVKVRISAGLKKLQINI